METFATYLSSASCGVPVRSGETFLISAQRGESDRRVAWFDTCNGSRRFGPGADLADFPDTPNDRIILRLQGLHIAHAVQNPAGSPGAPRLPKPGHPNAELIGLVELPGVSNLDEPVLPIGRMSRDFDGTREYRKLTMRACDGTAAAIS